MKYLYALFSKGSFEVDEDVLKNSGVIIGSPENNLPPNEFGVKGSGIYCYGVFCRMHSAQFVSLISSVKRTSEEVYLMVIYETSTVVISKLKDTPYEVGRYHLYNDGTPSFDDYSQDDVKKLVGAYKSVAHDHMNISYEDILALANFVEQYMPPSLKGSDLDKIAEFARSTL